MNGYSTLAAGCFSPPTAGNGGGGGGGRGRRSLELTNTKETSAWEGLAIGAVTLARTFSTGSYRLRGGSSDGEKGGGLPGAMRRAFSVRRHPAGRVAGGGYYWRIHDMDGDYDIDGRRHGAGEEEDEKKEEEAAKGEGEINEEEKRRRGKKKKRGSILKACKKLLIRL